MMLSASGNPSNLSAPNPFKFPRVSTDVPAVHDENAVTDSDSNDVFPGFRHSSDVGHRGHDVWQPRRHSGSPWQNPRPQIPGSRRVRQPSLSEALRNIHNRRGSVTDNAHEIAEALKAPISPKLVALCAIWYGTSILSNASSKSILTSFPQPVTLTIVQFAFVSSLCIISSQFAHRFPILKVWVPALKYDILRPNKQLIITTLPLTAFQIGGHILNSDAMSRIPVSLVHTIKGLSPLFTVMAYRLVFSVHYSVQTYLALIPLTVGVVMACSANLSVNMRGLFCAFGSAILFVTQNIVSKKLFNEAANVEREGLQQILANKKPDKLNLLCYSSGLALIITFPIWLWSEAPGISRDFLKHGGIRLADRPGALDHGRLSMEFIFNGTFHFAQSLVAFVLLSMVSPVTYSVASLIKRVFVILFAIVWWGNPMSRFQAVGIGLTFVGLYLYDRTNDAARADRRARMIQNRDNPILPLISEDKKVDLPSRIPSPLDMGSGPGPGLVTINGRAPSLGPHDRRVDRSRSPSKRVSSPGAGWLAPSTKQESTWLNHDVSSKLNVLTE